MRWFWIDRFTEFESGRSAAAVKNVSLSESHLHDHFPGAPVMPNSLVIEGLAQAGGILVAEHNHFKRRVVLAKVSSARFHFAAEPGDTLLYRTEVLDIQQHGAVVKGTSHVGARLQAEAELVFAHLDQQAGGTPLFEPEFFVNWLRNLKLYEVARAADGSPLMPPTGAEAAARKTSEPQPAAN